LSQGLDFVEYDYRGVELGVRRALGTGLTLDFAQERVERIDEFVGYFDYSLNVARLGLEYRPNSRLSASVGVSAQTYDFPNALAFNNPLAARRSIDTSRTDLQLEYAFSGSLALWIALESESTTSTDLREAFDRSIATVGIKWRRH